MKVKFVAQANHYALWFPLIHCPKFLKTDKESDILVIVGVFSSFSKTAC